jgi:hypothetical protein
LLDVEANADAVGLGDVEFNIDGRSATEVSYHVQLLTDAGLLEAIDLSDTAGLDWRPTRLTYAGHEFIEAARKDTLWQKANSTVMERTGGLSLDVLKAVLLKFATDAVLRG